MLASDLIKAVEYFEESVALGRNLRIIFTTEETEIGSMVDVTITEEEEHVFSDCGFTSFERAFMAAGLGLKNS
jgi:hypothetical protein